MNKKYQFILQENPPRLETLIVQPDLDVYLRSNNYYCKVFYLANNNCWWYLN